MGVVAGVDLVADADNEVDVGSGADNGADNELVLAPAAVLAMTLKMEFAKQN